MQPSLIVSEENSGERLDIYLVKKFPKKSRSKIQKEISGGNVLVNGKNTSVHHFIKMGDEITFTPSVSDHPKTVIPHLMRNPKKIKMVNLLDSPESVRGNDNFKLSDQFSDGLMAGVMEEHGGVEPHILYEDADVIVLEKPTGLLVHETTRKEPHTLVAWLVKKYPKIENVGEERYRAGIVHRLDKDVSGIMAVAKTQEMYEHLKKQFKKRSVTKEYIALVYGAPRHESGKINLPIGRNPKGKFVAHPKTQKKKLLPKDRNATTLYRVRERIKNFSVFEIQILTGRTHQIRAHLSHLGHPIVGDKEYGPKKSFHKMFSKKIKVISAPRIMLHSHILEFRGLDGKIKKFQSPLPKEFKKFLEQLKS